MPIYAFEGQRPELPAPGTYWIAPDAVLIGKVRVKPGASIWFGAVLRGDNEWIEVGEESNVQDMAMLHTDPGFPLTIGRGVTVAHKAILHGCTVGDDSLVGMGAIMLNGSAVGAGSLVGAGALITERKQFPDRSMVVGAPGKAIRSLDDEAVDGLRRAAQIYSDRFKRYIATLQDVTGA